MIAGIFVVVLPQIDFFVSWSDFIIENKILVDFGDQEIEKNGEMYLENMLYHFVWGWLGFVMMPIIVFWWFTQKIPTTWMVQKLNIEPRMKLVIFKNGKPIKFGKKK